MTPDHEKTMKTTLELAYSRTIEWNKSIAIPQGKNPPQYTYEMLWQCPLAMDLKTIADYVEGYETPEDITLIIARAARALFGETLDQSGFRLPRKFHQTPLGVMLFEAFARYHPPTAWMTTAEVQKLFDVKRQTIYDWAEEGKVAPYFVEGKQVYLRRQIEKFHQTWLRQKQSKTQKGIVTQLS